MGLSCWHLGWFVKFALLLAVGRAGRCFGSWVVLGLFCIRRVTPCVRCWSSLCSAAGKSQRTCAGIGESSCGSSCSLGLELRCWFCIASAHETLSSSRGLQRHTRCPGTCSNTRSAPQNEFKGITARFSTASSVAWAKLVPPLASCREIWFERTC